MADAPYLSMQRFPGNGTTTDWTVNFAGNTPSDENWYIEADDIEAIEIIPATALAAEVRIERTVTRIGPSQFRVTPAVASGHILVLRRKTENRFNLVDFQSLQAVSEYDLDLANKQLLFVTQEASDQARLAEDRAFEAGTVAYSSVNVSTEALATANSANTEATTAVSTANAASSTAGNAVATANSAKSTANSANSTANTALSTANAASATANTALSTANAANTKANTAIATANGAVDTAAAAAADASAALTASEQAELAAAAAQSSAAATELLAASADANAATALSTANGIDAKATTALDTANAASATATQAMTLIEEAGVSTFNGRAGVVMPLAGDYSAAQVSRGGSNVDADLTALESGKADTGHTHAIADVTGLQPALAGKAPAVHTHAIADVTGLQAAIDGKAASVHTHGIADVTGLQAALTAKVGKTGDVGAASIPAGATRQRPTATSGLLRVNTTTGLLEYAYLGNWYPLNIPTQTTNDNTAGRVIKNGDRQSIRAWVNFQGVNGIIIRGRFGINSVIRNDVGVYTIYFSQVFNSDWYACQVSSSRGHWINNLVSATIIKQFYDAVQVEVTREYNDARTPVDAEVIQVLVIGEYDNA